MSGLKELVATHAPSLLPLTEVLLGQLDTSQPLIQCPKAWSDLISALACQSPVCALIHPSDRAFDVLKKITDDDFTSNPLNMEILQEEFPIMFEVLRNVTHLPKQAITILISDLIKKANAPFENKESEFTLDSEEYQLSYFPHLPYIRSCGAYEADKSLRKAVGCIKQSSGHPSLLPGIFTLFCPHGMPVTLFAWALDSFEIS